MVDRRTPTRNDWSLAGSLLSETVGKVVVTAIVIGILLWAVKRWLDPLAVAVSLILEAMVFITVTWIDGRPARMHRGMHHLTDVIAGVLLGAASVVLVTWILSRAEGRRLSLLAAGDRAVGPAIELLDDRPVPALARAAAMNSGGST